MTSIVGILCRDGVVIGADSAATFSDGAQVRTIEQLTAHKIDIVGEQIIIAGTGYVGHGQRFTEAVRKAYDAKAFQGRTSIEYGKLLSAHGIQDFQQTNLQHIEYSALVAYPAENKACLCELPGGRAAFQPEVKNAGDLWFASSGSGQRITDPFLALFRSIFWKDGPPGLEGGIFTALWALEHACDVNPGGIKEPVRLAVLAREKGKLRARMLSEDELAEHKNMVAEATRHIADFREVVEGRIETSAVPKPDAES